MCEEGTHSYTTAMMIVVGFKPSLSLHSFPLVPSSSSLSLKPHPFFLPAKAHPLLTFANNNNNNNNNDNNNNNNNNNNNLKEQGNTQQQQQQPSNGNGSNSQEEEKVNDWSKQRRPFLGFNWSTLLDPDPDNVLALGLTGILTWASVQVLWQLLFTSFAILVAALKYSFIAALLLFILIALL